MHLLQSCNFNSFTFFSNSFLPCNTSNPTQFTPLPKLPLSAKPKSTSEFIKQVFWCPRSPDLRPAQVAFCYKNEVFEEVNDAQMSEISENEELELRNKPFPKTVDDGYIAEDEIETKKPSKSEVLESFYQYFRSRESLEEISEIEKDFDDNLVREDTKRVAVEYYEPKPGDFVVGVVVSGNENKLDVNVGADLLGTMLRKEVLPLYHGEMDYLSCDIEKDAEEFLVSGKMGILSYDEAMGGELKSGRPVLEPGTVLFAEVLGRTLSGRPLLSTRRLYRRMAWHRVRQIMQFNEPIEVKITEWNTGGLLTRLEGLRAFLPKAELVNKINNYTELKQNVGRRIKVLITRVNEDTNDLILSEKQAWEMLHLQEGSLLEGTVARIFPYGAQIRIGESTRSGLVHISNLSKGRVTSITDLLSVGEKVKVMVVKSNFPDKISLSIADLESEQGLFLSDKEKVFSQAEEMAKKYRQNLPAISSSKTVEPLSTCSLPFEEEEKMYANWEWFKFDKDIK